jgi:hypothetical protein
MTVAAGPFAIAAALLAIGGVLKACSPADTANALRAARLPGRPALVRLGGGAEAAVGVTALALGNRVTAVLVAISYLLFALFVVVALRRGTPIASCGCFGKLDTPPSRLHLGIDAAALVAALAVAADPGVGLVDVLHRQPLAGAPYLLLVGTGVGLALAALSSLPQTLGLVRAIGGRP